MMGIELLTCSLVAWRENGSEVEVEFALPTYLIRQNVIGQSGPLFRSWSARGKAASGLLEGGRVCLQMTSIIFTLDLSSHVDCISSSIPPQKAASHILRNQPSWNQPNTFFSTQPFPRPPTAWRRLFPSHHLQPPHLDSTITTTNHSSNNPTPNLRKKKCHPHPPPSPPPPSPNSSAPTVPPAPPPYPPPLPPKHKTNPPLSRPNPRSNLLLPPLPLHPHRLLRPSHPPLQPLPVPQPNPPNPQYPHHPRPPIPNPPRPAHHNLPPPALPPHPLPLHLPHQRHLPLLRRRPHPLPLGRRHLPLHAALPRPRRARQRRVLCRGRGGRPCPLGRAGWHRADLGFTERLGEGGAGSHGSKGRGDQRGCAARGVGGCRGECGWAGEGV